MKLIPRTILCGSIAALVILLGLINIAAQDNTNVPNGQKLEVNGIINTRDPDTFKMTTLNKSNSYIVSLTPSTSVKSNTKGVFRGGKSYESSYLLKGLRVQVVGYGNDAGQLVAETVRFNEQDLKTAQSLQSTLEP